MTKYINIVLVVAVMAVLWACHSSEANYRESYEKAIALNRTGERGERYQQELAFRTHNNFVVDGDSIRLRYLHFNITDDEPSVIKKYGVVVAEFQQKFNAVSCRDRLRSKEGLQAYVVYVEAEKTYCVVAEGYDDISVAATFVKNPQKYMKMKVLVPKAWVICSANRSNVSRNKK